VAYNYVSENEIVCYIAGNAITNEKVRAAGPCFNESEGEIKRKN